MKPPSVSKARDEHAWGRTNIDDRSTPEMLLDAAHLQAVMGDYAGAAELVQQCLRVHPDDQSLHFKLELYKGRRAKAAGHIEIARRHFERALEVAPTKKLAASVQGDLSGVDAASEGKKKSGGLASRLMGLSRKKK